MFTKYTISSEVATLLKFPLISVVKHIYVHTHTCRNRKVNQLSWKTETQEKEVINMDGYIKSTCYTVTGLLLGNPWFVR